MKYPRAGFISFIGNKNICHANYFFQGNHWFLLIWIILRPSENNKLAHDCMKQSQLINNVTIRA